MNVLLVQLEGIDHVALSVRDVRRSAQWYIDVLGFERQYESVWGDVPTFVGKGTTAIALFPLRGKEQSPDSQAGPRMLHLAMRADRKNFLVAQQELKQRGIGFEFQDHQIAHSIYFHDPDGYEIEITTYEIR